jgi:hypothetical protein
VPVQKNLSVEFNKHRRELNDMIKQLFPDDSTDLVDFLQITPIQCENNKN